MAKRFDATMRELFELEPAAWLEFLGIPVPDPRQVKVIDSNLSTFTAEADKVVRVGGDDPLIVHIEFLSGRDSAYPEQAVWYNTLLGRRHQVPVWTVLVLQRVAAMIPGVRGIWESSVYLVFLGIWNRRFAIRRLAIRSRSYSRPFCGISSVGPYRMAAWETEFSLLTARGETAKVPGDCPVTRISSDEIPRSSWPGSSGVFERENSLKPVVVLPASAGPMWLAGPVLERRSIAVRPGKAVRSETPGRTLGGTVREHDQPRRHSASYARGRASFWRLAIALALASGTGPGPRRAPECRRPPTRSSWPRGSVLAWEAAGSGGLSSPARPPCSRGPRACAPARPSSGSSRSRWTGARASRPTSTRRARSGSRGQGTTAPGRRCARSLRTRKPGAAQPLPALRPDAVEGAAARAHDPAAVGIRRAGTGGCTTGTGGCTAVAGPGVCPRRSASQVERFRRGIGRFHRSGPNGARPAAAGSAAAGARAAAKLPREDRSFSMPARAQDAGRPGAGNPGPAPAPRPLLRLAARRRRRASRGRPAADRGGQGCRGAQPDQPGRRAPVAALARRRGRRARATAPTPDRAGANRTAARRCRPHGPDHAGVAARHQHLSAQRPQGGYHSSFPSSPTAHAW